MGYAFNVSGEYGFYRISHTTTSAVSFPFITPTAAAGLIGALCSIPNGCDRNSSAAEFWKKLCGVKIGIGLLGEEQQMKHSNINLRDMYGTDSVRFQARRHVLRSPSFRIYVSAPESLETELRRAVETEEHDFPIYMGCREFAAKVEPVGNFTETPFKDGYIDTVLPITNTRCAFSMLFDITRSPQLKKADPAAFEMDDRRRPLTMGFIFYPRPPERIYIKDKKDLDITNCGGSAVAWFPVWGKTK